MQDVTATFEPHRRELCAYAYRMLGSSFEAEDAVQETFLRAWKSYDSFEGRSSLRSWLYRIATNVCLDMLDGPQRRARPTDFSPASDPHTPLGAPQPDYVWIEPIPDGLAYAEANDTLRLAFVAAVQHLPAKQRAILILREVLRFSAAETAKTLDISSASVNSALQRARATLGKVTPTHDTGYDQGNAEQRELIERYMAAFQSYDMDALTELMRDDVAMSMPPFDLWVSGPANVVAFMQDQGNACRDSRLIPLGANGLPAFGHYKPSDDRPGVWVPWSITVLELDGPKITGLNFFLDTARLFPLFGLTPELVP